MRVLLSALCGLAILSAAALGGCQRSTTMTEVAGPELDARRLDREIGALADRARPGVLGAAVIDLQTGQFWTFNGDLRFPLGGASAAPLAALVLAEADARRLSLDESIPVRDIDLSPPPSAVAAAWPERRAYSVRELLAAAAPGTDTTAADLLMKRVGGPGGVTAWLRLKNIEAIRLDRYAREVGPEAAGMASFRPAWTVGDAFVRARATIPPDRRRAALEAYLIDPRDTATPRGMIAFLKQLDDRTLLSPSSTATLLALLAAKPAGARGLQGGLPPGARFVHLAGAAPADLGVTPASYDLGLLTLKDGRRYAISVFLSGARLDPAARESLFADLGRSLAAGLG